MSEVKGTWQLTGLGWTLVATAATVLTFYVGFLAGKGTKGKG